MNSVLRRISNWMRLLVFGKPKIRFGIRTEILDRGTFLAVGWVAEPDFELPCTLRLAGKDGDGNLFRHDETVFKSSGETYLSVGSEIPSLAAIKATTRDSSGRRMYSAPSLRILLAGAVDIAN